MTSLKSFAAGFRVPRAGLVTGPALRLLRSKIAVLLLTLPVSMTPADAQQPIVDNGGPVMHGPIQAILIFWLPPGLHYDTNTNSSAGDTKYENTLSSFFTDLSGSTYFSLLTQYPGSCGVPQQQNCFGGISARAIVDPMPYGHTGDLSDALTDQNIRDEITRLINDPNNQLSGFDPLSTEFFVFTAAHVQICNPSIGCSFHLNGFDIGGWCAYHAFSGDFAYAVMPQDDSLGIGCHSGVNHSPHGRIADREIVAVSHELFESVSDPQGNAWINGDSQEIGDNCNQNTSATAPDGSNVTLNGKPYVVQEMWSNNDDACVLGTSFTVSGATVETEALTGNDDLQGGSSAAAILTLQDGTTQNVFLKSAGQPSWDNGSTHVRVSSFSLSPSSSLTKDVISLFSTSGDKWQVQSLDLKVRNPNGSFLCEQIGSGSPLATITAQQSLTLSTPNCIPVVAPPNFDSVNINIQTGNDDAGSDSQITAQLSGQSHGICLKPSTSSNLAHDPVCTTNGPNAVDQNGMRSWSNWSQNNQTFMLDTVQNSTSGFGTIDIIFTEGDPSCGDPFHEGCDNWDLQGITVSVFDSHSPQPHPTTILLNMSNPQNADNCIARLKAPPNATTVRFSLDNANPPAYANGKESGTITGCKNNGDNP